MANPTQNACGTIANLTKKKHVRCRLVGVARFDRNVAVFRQDLPQFDKSRRIVDGIPALERGSAVTVSSHTCSISNIVSLHVVCTIALFRI